ncbi:MAG: agmatinase [bacterium]
MPNSPKLNFLGDEVECTGFEASKVVIIPVLSEETVSYGKGASEGPGAILKASAYLEAYDIEYEKEVKDNWIYTENFIDDNWQNKLKSCLNSVLERKKFPVIIGGEHSISYPAAKVLLTYFPDMSVLQFDAHSDLRDIYEGRKDSHACVMKRIRDLGVNTIGVGMRSMCSQEAELIKREKIPIFTTHYIRKHGNWRDKVLHKLGQRVYITFDVDVFDPSFIPSTGTPEPGGLFWYEIMDFMKYLAESGKDVIGFDLVEFAPIKCLHGPDYSMAKLILKLILLFSDRNNDEPHIRGI